MSALRRSYAEKSPRVRSGAKCSLANGEPRSPAPKVPVIRTEYRGSKWATYQKPRRGCRRSLVWQCRGGPLPKCAIGQRGSGGRAVQSRLTISRARSEEVQAADFYLSRFRACRCGPGTWTPRSDLCGCVRPKEIVWCNTNVGGPGVLADPGPFNAGASPNACKSLLRLKLERRLHVRPARSGSPTGITGGGCKR